MGVASARMFTKNEAIIIFVNKFGLRLSLLKISIISMP